MPRDAPQACYVDFHVLAVVLPGVAFLPDLLLENSVITNCKLI